MMSKNDNEVVIPITNIGRKYGYIIWHAERDEEIKAIFGERDRIDFQFEDSAQKNKRIDWQKRRVSITGSFTQRLPRRVKNIRLKRQAKKVFVTFE